MKHLKIFEDFKFDVGDYIHLANAKSWTVYPDVKIVDRDSHSSIGQNYDYYIEAQMKIDNRIEPFWIDLEDIERESTPEEIEAYKLRKNTNKYNL